MIPIQIHYQNIDGDGGLYRWATVRTQLPAMPRKGETVYGSSAIAKEFLGKIMASDKSIRTWSNLIHYDCDRGHFMSIQENFVVEDTWYNTEDGTAHVLLGDGSGNGSMQINFIDKVFAEIRKNFEEGKMWY
jgi:hypothetical protein